MFNTSRGRNLSPDVSEFNNSIIFIEKHLRINSS
ncbi:MULTISPECIES: hypothetical protein [Staphylococcus]|nr:hypothetical protein [Staphylococcus shinii]QRA16720.1 hypothetical protein JMB28_00410 [Staphylococcus shinii]